MTRSTDPAKNVSTPPPTKEKKMRCKAVQSNILWLNLNKNGWISILQSAHKHGNPSFHFHAPGSKREYIYALKQPRLSQNISPVCSSFVLVIASDMHPESQSEKRAKNADLHTAKNIQIEPTFFFVIFRRILRN